MWRRKSSHDLLTPKQKSLHIWEASLPGPTCRSLIWDNTDSGSYWPSPGGRVLLTTVANDLQVILIWLHQDWVAPLSSHWLCYLLSLCQVLYSSLLVKPCPTAGPMNLNLMSMSSENPRKLSWTDRRSMFHDATVLSCYSTILTMLSTPCCIGSPTTSQTLNESNGFYYWNVLPLT